MGNVQKADPAAGTRSPVPRDGLQAWRSRSSEGSRLQALVSGGFVLS